MQVLAEPLHWIEARRCRDEIASINSSKTTSGVRSLPSGLLTDFPAAIELRIQYLISDTEVMDKGQKQIMDLFLAGGWLCMFIAE